MKRARCKAAKCGVAIAMRMLKRGNVGAALVHSVKALGVGGSGTTGGREGQELASEAMEVWADAHTMLGKMSSSEVKAVQEAIDQMMVEERIVKTESQGEGGRGAALTGGEGSPLAHPLSLDVEANSNHAVRAPSTSACSLHPLLENIFLQALWICSVDNHSLASFLSGLAFTHSIPDQSAPFQP